MEVNDLPFGWARVPLGEITVEVEQVDPAHVFDNEFTYLDISSIDNRVNRIVEPRRLSAGEAPSRARQRVIAGDVLLSTVRTYLENTAYVEDRFDGQIASTGFCVLRAASGIEPRYLYHFALTRDFVQRLSSLQRGVSYPAVRDDDVRGQSIPLAPSKEQRRIVEKIDELFSDIEEGERALERARKLPDRYRQAVLKAAVSGELTKDWREKHRGEIESGENLLTRILKTRRETWEQAELAKMRVKGRQSDDDRWKQRYQEPAPTNTAHFSPLPHGWVWMTVEQVCDGARPIAYGVLQPGSHQEDGIPIVRVSDIAEGHVDQSSLKRIEPSIAREYKRTVLEGGEVLLTVVGSIGRTAVVPPDLTGANIARAVAMLPVLPGVMARWLEIWLRFEPNRQRLEGLAHEVARKTLNLEDVRAFPVPIPTAREQQEVCDIAEDSLSVLRHLSAELAQCVEQAQILRQSILAAAFSGKLVPQDTSDEPASTLLDRIRAERAAAGKPPVKRRGRQPSKAGKVAAEPELPLA